MSWKCKDAYWGPSQPLRMLAIDAGETSGEMPLEHGSIARKNPQEPSLGLSYSDNEGLPKPRMQRNGGNGGSGKNGGNGGNGESGRNGGNGGNGESERNGGNGGSGKNGGNGGNGRKGGSGEEESPDLSEMAQTLQEVAKQLGDLAKALLGASQDQDPYLRHEVIYKLRELICNVSAGAGNDLDLACLLRCLKCWDAGSLD